MATERPEMDGPHKTPSLRDRRSHSRHSVDAQVCLVLVKSGSVLRGTILDLSLGGCRVRCQEKFLAGIYTRVETEFDLEGLPFLLAGVIQSIHSSHIVGICFLDVSPRKRNQIQQLIHEIEEMRSESPITSDGAADVQG